MVFLIIIPQALNELAVTISEGRIRFPEIYGVDANTEVIHASMHFYHKVAIIRRSERASAEIQDDLGNDCPVRELVRSLEIMAALHLSLAGTTQDFSSRLSQGPIVRSTQQPHTCLS